MNCSYYTDRLRMLPRFLIFLLFACSYASGQSLSAGMSVEAVKTEIGRPESTMALGSKEVLIYPDGTRLEFTGGKLVKENDTVLTGSPQAEPKPTAKSTEPLMDTSSFLQKREIKTVSGSEQASDVEGSQTSINSPYSDVLKNIEDIINLDAPGSTNRQTGQQRLTALLIGFGLEFAVTLIVISLAFRISGFPSVFWQMLSLSLAVALVSALIDFVLGSDALNPVRSVAGLLVLIVLIRQLTDVREWATAIKIAVICRIVSFAIIWVLMIGATMLFSL